jgi:phosphocarrier protein
MIQKAVRIENELGLHARAAAKLVKLAGRFASEIHLSRCGGNQEINAKSILGVLLLAAGKGTELMVTVHGRDEEQALSDIMELIRNKFGEGR